MQSIDNFLYRYFNSEVMEMTDNMTINDFDDNDGKFGESLQVESMTRNLAGEYSCQVSNYLGTGNSETALVEVLCKF